MVTQERDDIYLDKIIRKEFSASLMNNKKWVKLISILVENAGLIKECRVKLIWENQNETRFLRIDEFFQYNFDFYDTAMEAMITGKPAGWYAYKEIEWLDFPRFVISTDKRNVQTSVEQNLALIKTKIEQIGQFHFDCTPNNLRISAYLRV
jgi:hypothetical protein